MPWPTGQEEIIHYSEQEFVDVVVSVLTQQLGKEPGLAEYIARQVAQRTRDPRQAIQLAKLVDSEEEVDRFEDGARVRKLNL